MEWFYWWHPHLIPSCGPNVVKMHVWSNIKPIQPNTFWYKQPEPKALKLIKDQIHVAFRDRSY